MIWVTKKRIKVNRAATAWLIRRFIDPTGTIRFVEPAEVAEVQRREGATGFDAPGQEIAADGGFHDCSEPGADIHWPVVDGAQHCGSGR